MRDWDAWHVPYGDPSSMLSERLRLVQAHVADWLEATAPRPVTVVSSCAGDGRDLLHVLEDRNDAHRVTATLIEADHRNAARAADRIRRSALPGVVVRRTDAGAGSAYAGAVPADLVLLCGIFGNITDDDVKRTIAAAPQLCAANAVVIWTRHRREPDLTPRIRRWFGRNGFEELRFMPLGTPSTRWGCTASGVLHSRWIPISGCSPSPRSSRQPVGAGGERRLASVQRTVRLLRIAGDAQQPHCGRAGAPTA